MRRAAILGMGQVSAVGAGVDALRAALAGTRPAPQWIPCAPGNSEDEKVPVLCASAKGIEKLTEPRGLRRLDPFAQRTLYAALLALQDSKAPAIDPERVGVIVATGRGPIATSFAFLDETIEKGDGLGSPVAFANSVHGSAAAAISSTLGFRGPMITVAGSSFAWSEALALAIDWLDRSLADRVVLASGDEFHRVAGYAINRLGGFASDGKMRPLDFEKCSFVPGETFSAFVLAREGELHFSLKMPHPPAPSPPARRGCPLFVAAQGIRDEGAAFLSWARSAVSVAAYSSLWGGNPTCDSLTALTAALSLRDRTLFPVPERGCSSGIKVLEPGSSPPTRIDCLSLDSTGSGVIVGVE